MLERIIAVNSNSYHGFPLVDAIRGIMAAGFKHIELTATEGWTEHVFPSMSFAKLCQIQNLLSRADLSVIGLSGHSNLMDPARLPHFKNNIRMAAFFGASYIISSIGEAHISNSVQSRSQTVIEHIKMLLPELEKHKLCLALEVHGHDYGSGASLQSIVRNINSPLVGINYDTANAIFYGNVQGTEDFAQCIHNVSYLHIKDKAGKQSDWNFPALGKGYVNFPAIFQILDNTQNHSPLSIEIEFTQDGAVNVEEVDQAILESARYLRQLDYML